jgi:hypothetical protein
MRVFLAGVMQGNMKQHGVRSQSYRTLISDIVLSQLRDAEIIDPDKTDPERLDYDNSQSANMFFRYCNMAGEVNLLIAYLPEASMGSAIEMWSAHQANIPIITISPLTHNWVVKLLSTKVYSDIEKFKLSFNPELLKELHIN